MGSHRTGADQGIRKARASEERCGVREERTAHRSSSAARSPACLPAALELVAALVGVRPWAMLDLMGRKLPDQPLSFICACIGAGRVFWTYHVNMRLSQRFLTHQAILVRRRPTSSSRLIQKTSTSRATCSWARETKVPSMCSSESTWRGKTFGPSPPIARASTSGKPI
jgi:hypothetical protein